MYDDVRLSSKAKTYSIVSLVLGIVSIVLSFTPFISFLILVAGIIGIVFSTIATLHIFYNY